HLHDALAIFIVIGGWFEIGAERIDQLLGHFYFARVDLGSFAVLLGNAFWIDHLIAEVHRLKAEDAVHWTEGREVFLGMHHDLDLHDALAIFIVIGGWFEIGAERIDQLLGHFYFARVDLGSFAVLLGNAFWIDHLIAEVHRLKAEDAVHWTEGREVFLGMHHD